MAAESPPPPPPPPPPPQPEPTPQGGDGRGPEPLRARRAPLPALKRTIVRPARQRPDPADAAFVATRLTTLTHELSNLLDGSLRVISLARRSLPSPCSHASADHDAPSPERLAKHLDTVHGAMKQMAELVRCSMNGTSYQRLDGVRAAIGSTGSMSEAIQHAAEVMIPLAEERGVRIECECGGELSHVRAGPVFGVVAAAVKNSIESIHALGGVGGNIEIVARVDGSGERACVEIDISDDGQGPPRISGKRLETVFRYGFTTKPDGQGVGLAVCRDMVRQLRGWIKLERRPFNPETGRGGAILRMSFPVPPSVFVEDEDIGHGG